MRLVHISGSMEFEGSRKAAAQSKRPSSHKRKIKFLRTFIKKRVFFGRVLSTQSNFYCNKLLFHFQKCEYEDISVITSISQNKAKTKQNKNKQDTQSLKQKPQELIIFLKKAWNLEVVGVLCPHCIQCYSLYTVVTIFPR